MRTIGALVPSTLVTSAYAGCEQETATSTASGAVRVQRATRAQVKATRSRYSIEPEPSLEGREQRQGNAKHRAAFGAAQRLDRTIVNACDAPYDGEAEAGSGDRPVARRVRAVKAIEHTPECRFIDPDARIRNGHDGVACAAKHCDVDATGIREFNCVID
jgi:hypothetical protein